MARTYHRDSKGRFASRGGGRGSSIGSKATKAATTAVKKSSPFANVQIQRIGGGGGTISQADAAAIMFGSGARKKLAGSKVRRRR